MSVATKPLTTETLKEQRDQEWQRFSQTLQDYINSKDGRPIILARAAKVEKKVCLPYTVRADWDSYCCDMVAQDIKKKTGFEVRFSNNYTNPNYRDVWLHWE